MKRLPTAANKAIYNYYDSLIIGINNNIKAIVGGWGRGYSPDTVADHLIDTGFNKMASSDYGVKDTEFLIHAIYTKLGYSENKAWDVDYNYTPSLNQSISVTTTTTLAQSVAKKTPHQCVHSVLLLRWRWLIVSISSSLKLPRILTMFELKSGVILESPKHDGDADYKHACESINTFLHANSHARDIVAGWRHGYSPEAVAHYILSDLLLASTDR